MTKVCPNCGSKMEEGASYCVVCGTKYYEPNANQNVNNTDNLNNMNNMNNINNMNNNYQNYNQNTSNMNNNNYDQNTSNMNVNQQTENKSKICAGLLGIFLGALGVHNFYLGYTGKGVAQLLISLLSFGLLSWISGIWGFIEGIMILTGSINKDASGNPLTD